MEGGIMEGRGGTVLVAHETNTRAGMERTTRKSLA